ncbi:MAG: hypothetical protein H6631_13250 [Anaerolineaceae bacterium]|nr:hypothetical protein [Anaerolineaceae bacterium]MCB9098270.1 hypothetical protein [Anaerolineales bacterium]
MEYLYTILRYVAGGTEKIERREFIEVVQAIFETGENSMPTLLEQWLRQKMTTQRNQRKALGFPK